MLYIVLFFVVLFYFYYYCYNFFLFGGGGSLWGCLCCNCVHVIRIDKSDIWPKVKVEYPWKSDNVICWINKARLNMMEVEYIHKHWNTWKIKTTPWTLWTISAVLPVLYSSCWDLASIFMMKTNVFHGLWLVYIYPIFIFFYK